MKVKPKGTFRREETQVWEVGCGEKVTFGLYLILMKELELHRFFG